LQTVCYSIVLKFDPLLLSPSLGEHKSAISDFTTAIKLDPDYPAAYNNRGVAYGNLGEHRSAISDYTTAIKLDPDYADAYKNRGIAKVNAGLSYCSDFKKACELGIKRVCEVYNDHCR